MAKYGFEFKLKVVQEYLEGKGGYKYLTKKYGIPSKVNLQTWVDAYNAFGTDGLMRSRKNKKYSFDFKLHVVKLYLTKEVSYQELTLQFGISNPSMLSQWVRDFGIAGPDALKPKRKGRRPNMAKSKDTPPLQDKNESVDSEYLKQLEEENLMLRIENAYLKELRRLRLEGKPQSKKRELYTASNENSD